MSIVRKMRTLAVRSGQNEQSLSPKDWIWVDSTVRAFRTFLKMAAVLDVLGTLR